MICEHRQNDLCQYLTAEIDPRGFHVTDEFCTGTCKKKGRDYIVGRLKGTVVVPEPSEAEIEVGRKLTICRLVCKKDIECKITKCKIKKGYVCPENRWSE